MQNKHMQNKKIGFIGQGWIGKNYANNFEHRGFEVVRYGHETDYNGNKEKIKECDVVFIAVPTPSTPEGFDDSTVREVLALVGKHKIAVIKSTVIPGSTKTLQKDHQDAIVLFVPEFLSETTVQHDIAHPFTNTIGIPISDDLHKNAAKIVQEILPKAPHTLICDSTEAEIIKYAHNTSGYVQIILFNMVYDLAKSLGADWKNIQEAIEADPYICNRYANPIHKNGRGAGGNCFIKDFAAFIEMYEKRVGNKEGAVALRGFEQKNIALLKESGKDADLLRSVYGVE